MKFLIDSNRRVLDEFTALYPTLIGGQFLTPLSNRRAVFTEQFAVDNGAFVRFDLERFYKLLEAVLPYASQCLFVACPDIVGNGRRTLEVYRELGPRLKTSGWKPALVAQDGIDDLDIPWSCIDAVFIGGTDNFKGSKAALDVCKAAGIRGKHVHVGRVNDIRRYTFYAPYGDTCDGTGMSRFPDKYLADMCESILKAGRMVERRLIGEE